MGRSAVIPAPANPATCAAFRPSARRARSDARSASVVGCGHCVAALTLTGDGGVRNRAAFALGRYGRASGGEYTSSAIVSSSVGQSSDVEGAGVAVVSAEVFGGGGIGRC